MPGSPQPRPAEAVLVPVKAFEQAKGRLAAVLSPAQRAALARAMATIVVGAAAPLPVFVVCDDPAVRAWAAELGAAVLWTPGRGLNQAVTDAVAEVASAGVERVVVAHSDLPLAGSLVEPLPAQDVVIVPDRRADGTNVIALPSRAGFRFAYGAGSYRAHRREAARLGLAVRVVEHPLLGFDIDLPEDLHEARLRHDGLHRLLSELR